MTRGYRFGRVYGYHRTLLDGERRRLYDGMADVLESYPAERSLSVDGSFGDEELMFVLTGLLNDRPLLFWVEPSISIARCGGDADVGFRHNALFDSRDALTGRLESVCDSVRDGMSGPRDDYSVSLALHDMLTRRTAYGDTGVIGHCAAGPLLDGRGVCEGISEAYCLLMTSLGVGCTKVNGRLSGSDVGHSWNISAVDGHFCHTDVTSDLPGYHRFFNLDDGTMGLTHGFRRFVECDSMDASYYVRRKCLFGRFGDLKRHVPLGMRFSRDFEFMLGEPADPDEVLDFFGGMRGGSCICTSSDDRRGFRIRDG